MESVIQDFSMSYMECPTKHDSSELMNSLECRLPNTGLDLKTFCSLVRQKNLLFPYILICDRFYYNTTAILCLLLLSLHFLASNNLKNYGRRYFKIFTNCHVSWDTLLLSNILKKNWRNWNNITIQHLFVILQQQNYSSKALTNIGNTILSFTLLHQYFTLS